MQQVTGTIFKIYEKNGQSARGPYTIRSIKLDNDPNFYGLGFTPTPVQLGPNMSVSFEFDENDKYKNVDHESIKIVQQEVSINKNTNTAKSTYPTAEERIATSNHMRYQGALDRAISFLNVALTHECLTLPAKKATRYDVLLELTDQLTIRFYRDTENLGHMEEDPSILFAEEGSSPMNAVDHDEIPS